MRITLDQGQIVIHESYEGELAIDFVDPYDVDPAFVCGYVLGRMVGDDFATFEGEHSTDGIPVTFSTLDEAEGARSMLADADTWEVFAMVWADDEDDGDGGDELELPDDPNPSTLPDL